MKRYLIPIAITTVVAQAQTVDLAEGLYLQYKVETTSYNQWYLQEALYEGQEDYASFFSLSPDLTFQSDFNTDLRIKPKFWYEINDKGWRFEDSKFRGDKRNRLYFEELYLDHYGDAYEVRAGVQTWAFKTVESFSPNDVINAVDNEIDFTDAPKYGELALRLRSILPTESEQVLEFTWLPYLQPTMAPGPSSRFNFFGGAPFALDQAPDQIEYNKDSKEWFSGYLIRYTTIWFESFDVAFMGFYGYDRTPHYVINLDQEGQPLKAVPRYETAFQLGAQFQGALGPWLFKGETMGHQYEDDEVVTTRLNGAKLQSTKTKPSIAMTLGTEYTLYSPLIDGHDLGLIVEGIYNSDTHLKDSEQIRFQPFKNHLFTGLRYVFNTPSDRTILAGGFISVKEPETLMQIEYEERLWQMIKIKLRGIFLYGSQESALKNFERGRRLDAEISYTF